MRMNDEHGMQQTQQASNEEQQKQQKQQFFSNQASSVASFAYLTIFDVKMSLLRHMEYMEAEERQ